MSALMMLYGVTPGAAMRRFALRAASKSFDGSFSLKGRAWSRFVPHST
jgi:hypothetical protein